MMLFNWFMQWVSQQMHRGETDTYLELCNSCYDTLCPHYVSTCVSSLLQLLYNREVFDQVVKQVFKVEQALIQYQDYLARLKLLEVANSSDNLYQLGTNGTRYDCLVIF